MSDIETALQETLDKAIELIDLLRGSVRQSNSLLGVICAELGDIEDHLNHLDIEEATRRTSRLTEILRDGLLELALIGQ